MRRLRAHILAFALSLTVILSGASAVQAGATVSVTFSPVEVQFTQKEFETISGSRNLNVSVSRRDGGLFCERVRSVEIAVENPEYPPVRYSKAVGTGGLCNFDQTVQVELIKNDAAASACSQNEGSSKRRSRMVRVELLYNSGKVELIKNVPIYANFQCACRSIKISTDGIPAKTFYIGKDNKEWLFQPYGHPPFTLQTSGALPQGMVMYQAQTSNGDRVGLKGQPLAEGNYTFTVQMGDLCKQSTQKTFTVPIRCSAFKFPDNIQLPPASVGASYSYQLQTSCNNAYTQQTYTGQGLPAGLSISPSGLIAGTATQFGTFEVNVKSTSSSFQTPAQKTIPLQVKDTVPPSMSVFSVSKNYLNSQGGQVNVLTKASDAGGIELVYVILVKPDGAQSGYFAQKTSGTKYNGEWNYTLNLPANSSTSVDAVYGIKAMLKDTAGNTVTGPTRSVTVAKMLGKAAIPQGSQTQQNDPRAPYAPPIIRNSIK
jgi:hypothetical protein